MLENDGILEQKDYDLIENNMRMIEKEVSPAPEGLINESLKRLKMSIGAKREQVMKNLN